MASLQKALGGSKKKKDKTATENGSSSTGSSSRSSPLKEEVDGTALSKQHGDTKLESVTEHGSKADKSVDKHGDKLLLKRHVVNPKSDASQLLTSDSVSSKVAQESVPSLMSEEKQKPMPPKFAKELKDCEVIEGDSARFDVKVSGCPEPDVTWYKDGKEISESRHFVMEEDEDGVCTLIVRNVTDKDEGDYECKAKNSKGEIACTGDLYVRRLL